MKIRGSGIDGKLVVQHPTDLPEGTVVDLVLDDGGDDLTADEIARLDAQLALAEAQAQAGQTTPAATVLQALRHDR